MRLKYFILHNFEKYLSENEIFKISSIANRNLPIFSAMQTDECLLHKEAANF